MKWSSVECREMKGKGVKLKKMKLGEWRGHEGIGVKWIRGK